MSNDITQELKERFNDLVDCLDETRKDVCALEQRVEALENIGTSESFQEQITSLQLELRELRNCLGANAYFNNCA